MKEKSEKYHSDFIIKEPKPPLYKKILSSIVYTAFCGYAFYLIKVKILAQGIDVMVVLIYLLWILLVILILTVPHINIHRIHLNFEHLKIKHTYEVGPIFYSEKWQDLKNLEYISVFNVGDGYDIRLWYKKNNILSLFYLEDYEKAIDKGFTIAKSLNIDLLDASKRGYHKWIDMKHYEKSKEIIYTE